VWDPRVERMALAEAGVCWAWLSAVLPLRSAVPGLRFCEMAKRAHAGPSPIAGLGIFASSDLPAATPVTLYPVHALGDASLALSRGTEASLFGETATKANRMLPSHPSLRDWADDLWIDASRERARVAGWLGHLVNDGAVCTSPDEIAICQYYEKAAASTNAVLSPFGEEAAPLMCWVTTRPVSKGEELLGSYGHGAHSRCACVGAAIPY
jgi:hypothetical protein